MCFHVQAGYTHYFTWNKTPDNAELKKCVQEMGLIVEARKGILAGSNGPDSKTILDLTHVDLNGVGTNECEPFVFPGEVGFNFCKTEGLPYDDVVTACLIVARDHFPSSVLSIGSDGDWSQGDWNGGAKLYSDVLGRPAHDPIDGMGLGNSFKHVLMEKVLFPIITISLFLFVFLLWRKIRRGF